MPLNRIVPQARPLPLPSPDVRYIDRNITVDRFNEQNHDSDYDRDRDLAYDQTVEDIRRRSEQERILSDATMGALGGVVAGQESSAPSIATPGFNPSAPPPGGMTQMPDTGPAAPTAPVGGGQPLDPRAYGVDVARRMAGAGYGGQAASALDGVFAMDQQQGQQKDKRYEQVLGLAAKGDPQQAAALAQRYGIQIPPEILRNGRMAQAFLTAGQIYDDPQQAAAFAQEMLANGGDPQAAYAKVGAPRGQPQKPQGSTLYDDQGGAYWAPDGGGALSPYTGAPEGARFQRGGQAGRTDPALTAKRIQDAAKAAADNTPGALQSNGLGDEARTDVWYEVYQREMSRLRAASGEPTAAGAGMPPPPPVPSMSMGGGQVASAEPPPEAVQELLRNASPRAIAEFDEVFGQGAAERVLDENGMFGDPD